MVWIFSLLYKASFPSPNQRGTPYGFCMVFWEAFDTRLEGRSPCRGPFEWPSSFGGKILDLEFRV